MLAWLSAHWWWVLIAVVVLVALFLLVLLPAWRRWRFRRRMLKEQERLRDDLLLRKELAEVARGRVSPEDKVLRTRLEDLRTAFDDGLNRLDAAGRGRHGMPWLLVLGEPGAGKTAALRHSGLPFPADLVDARQGEAGTETMHWWISERAAYLDLAGSILFARWGNQGNAEWRQFLDLLARRRRRLPLDGLVLCLPADALLADTPDAAGRKSALLAEEIGRLHRTLGLLLPTWVVVTKLDRVMGFVHATAGLDAAARDAAFAWSNPAADGTYDRAQLRGWFDATAERLERMRALAVTGDGWWEDAAGHRAERMAELHPLAGQMHRLGEALDRTLAAVFTGSPWSAGGRSLLMGVGLCSSLDDGRPLDLEAAAARGCDPEELSGPERPAATARSCFLNGLFAGRLPADARRVAYSPQRARRARRPWQIAAGLLGLGAVAGAIGTAMGLSALAERIRPQTGQWSWLEQLSTRTPLAQATLVVPPAGPASAAQVVADEPVPASADTRRGDLLTATWEAAERRLPVPFWLRLTAPGDGTIDGDLLADDRRGAYRLLLSTLLVRPLVDAARVRLADSRTAWSPEAHAALVQLLAIELGPGGADQPLDLTALGRFAVAGDAHEQTDLEVLLAAQPVAGCRPDPAAAGWDRDLRNLSSPLAGALGGGTVASGRPLQAGIGSFCREWTGDEPHRGTRLAHAVALVAAMGRYTTAEDALSSTAATITGRSQAAWSLAQADEAVAAWTRAWNRLDDAAKALADAARDAEHHGGRVEDLITEAIKDYQARLDSEFTALLDPIARRRATGRPLTSYAAGIESSLRDARDKGRRAANAAADRATAAASGLAAVFANGTRAWGGQDNRLGLLAPVAAELARSDAGVPLAQTDEELRRLAARCADLAARATPVRSDKDAPVDPRAQAVAEAARAALDVHLRRRATRMLTAAFKAAGDTSDAVADAVAALAANRPPLPRPEVPLAAGDAGPAFSPRWHPNAATDHLAAVAAVTRWALPDPAAAAPVPLADTAELARAAQDRRSAAAAYERAYVSYWAETVRDQGLPAPANDWAAFRASCATLEPNQVNNALRLVGDQVLRSLAIPLRDEEASRRGQAARLALEDERQGFAGALGAACRAATTAWRSLPADPAAARSALLGMPGDALKQSLLAAYDDRRSGLAVWWNAFALRGLAALRDECLARARKDRETVFASFDRFPLRAGDAGGEALTPDQLRQAAALLTALAPVPAPAGTAAGALDELSAALAALRDPLAAAGLGADAARLRSMHQIARALVDDTTLASWVPVAPGPEVFRIPVVARGRYPAVLAIRYLGVRYDPQRPPVRLQAAADPGGQAAVCDGIPVVSGDIDVLTYRHADEEAPMGTVRLAGAWAAVRLAIDPEARRDADGTVWAPLSTGGTDPRVLWLGLRFSRPLPPASAWAGAAARP